MGLFSKLFTRKEKTIVDYAFYQRLINTIVVSKELKVNVLRSVKKIFENDPKHYDPHIRSDLSQRGLTTKIPKNVIAEFILINQLIDQDEMTELDWKEEESEIRLSIKAIIVAKNYNCKLSLTDKFGKNTNIEKILEVIKKEEMEPFGYTIEDLDINSDSYVLTVVPLHLKKTVRMMFDDLKHINY